jgi:hypothetical protein
MINNLMIVNDYKLIPRRGAKNPEEVKTFAPFASLRENIL